MSNEYHSESMGIKSNGLFEYLANCNFAGVSNILCSSLHNSSFLNWKREREWIYCLNRFYVIYRLDLLQRNRKWLNQCPFIWWVQIIIFWREFILISARKTTSTKMFTILVIFSNFPSFLFIRVLRMLSWMIAQIWFSHIQPINVRNM